MLAETLIVYICLLIYAFLVCGPSTAFSHLRTIAQMLAASYYIKCWYMLKSNTYTHQFQPDARRLFTYLLQQPYTGYLTANLHSCGISYALSHLRTIHSTDYIRIMHYPALVDRRARSCKCQSKVPMYLSSYMQCIHPHLVYTSMQTYLRPLK
jgi:hypothetical protein